MRLSNPPPFRLSFFFFCRRENKFFVGVQKEAKKTCVRTMLRVGFRVFSLGTYLTP